MCPLINCPPPRPTHSPSTATTPDYLSIRDLWFFLTQHSPSEAVCPSRVGGPPAAPQAVYGQADDHVRACLGGHESELQRRLAEAALLRRREEHHAMS